MSSSRPTATRVTRGDCALHLRAGNFSEDSRGRWYLNICVPRAQRVGGERNKPSVGSILDRSVPSLGIDLGLKRFAAFSDGMPPIDAERFYRDLEPALARAQRARQRTRTRAIHAKIANRRRDFLHKLSTRLVTGHGALFVGNVNASEAFSTQTCSVCNSRAGPKGRQGLGMRGWQCAVCGAIHDRDVNAAHNILAAGHRRLAEGILVP